MDAINRKACAKNLMPSIQVKNLEVSFKNHTVLKGLDFEISHGEKFGILGPSGEGKTTILKAVAGLLIEFSNAHLEGNIYLNGDDMTYNGPTQRNIGMVFQERALFPNMNVEENLTFPLRIRKRSKKEIESELNRFLNLLQLTEKRKFNVEQLSGGQKQRVALGRALIYNPSLVLMDEPLKGLDPSLKISFLDHLLELHKELGFTLLYVTHDLDEAFYVCDKVAILNQGIFSQIGTPEELYHSPNNPFVARFVGRSNWLRTYIRKTESTTIFQIENMKFESEENLLPDLKEGDFEGYIWIRPEYVRIYDRMEKPNNTPNLVLNKGHIVNSKFFGQLYEYEIKTESNFRILAQTPKRFLTKDVVVFGYNLEDIRFFQGNKVHFMNGNNRRK